MMFTGVEEKNRITGKNKINSEFLGYFLIIYIYIVLIKKIVLTPLHIILDKDHKKTFVEHIFNILANPDKFNEDQINKIEQIKKEKKYKNFKKINISSPKNILGSMKVCLSYLSAIKDQGFLDQVKKKKQDNTMIRVNETANKLLEYSFNTVLKDALETFHDSTKGVRAVAGGVEVDEGSRKGVRAVEGVVEVDEGSRKGVREVAGGVEVDKGSRKGLRNDEVEENEYEEEEEEDEEEEEEDEDEDEDEEEPAGELYTLTQTYEDFTDIDTKENNIKLPVGIIVVHTGYVQEEFYFCSFFLDEGGEGEEEPKAHRGYIPSKILEKKEISASSKA